MYNLHLEESEEVVHSVKRDQRDREQAPNPPSEVFQQGACGTCVRSHSKDSCPSVGKTWLNFKKGNHFTNTREQQVHEVSDNPYQISDSLFLECITEEVDQINDIDIRNKNTPISFKLDAGA